YLGTYPISASLSRPFLAKTALDYANETGFSALLHTATSYQNSLRRFNGALRHLGTALNYGSPYELSTIPRSQKIQELASLSFNVFDNREISCDSNIWCTEYESGLLNNPETLRLEDIPFYQAEAKH